MKIKNGMSYEKNGWTYISISGSPKERGYAYGYLCAKQFKEIQRMLDFSIPETYGDSWNFFIQKVNADFKDITQSDFPEFYEEMLGITEGCCANGTKTTIDEIIAWNFYYSIPYWYSSLSSSSGAREGGSKDRCSAFIAVGDWTEDSKIVVAHNSFCDFVDGQYSNVILDLNPQKGNRFIMQTCPCWIWSGSDFFVTSKGIVGTETTIGGFDKYKKNWPIGYRIRKAMQYGNTLDEYVEILLKENSGDYANSWLFGDTNTNEIMRLELGLDYHKVERTKNGFFIGFNAPYDSNIRNKECSTSGFYDIRRHQGARKVRLSDLMDEYKGKLNIDIAKKIIADHYDVYLLKDNNPCSRTICSHYDLDPREYMSQPNRPVPFAPHGAVDGIVSSTDLIKKMSFVSRWGNSCGTPFIKDDYCKKHRQWENFAPYLKDRLSQPWTEFSVAPAKSKPVSRPLFSKKNKTSNSKTKKNKDDN